MSAKNQLTDIFTGRGQQKAELERTDRDRRVGENRRFNDRARFRIDAARYVDRDDARAAFVDRFYRIGVGLRQRQPCAGSNQPVKQDVSTTHGGCSLIARRWKASDGHARCLCASVRIAASFGRICARVGVRNAFHPRRQARERRERIAAVISATGKRHDGACRATREDCGDPFPGAAHERDVAHEPARRRIGIAHLLRR